jgi:hypothetical protein
MLKPYRPLSPFDPFRWPLPETPEVEFITVDGDFFRTADDKQLVVQED